MYLTGLYHAIKNATGTEITNPSANPQNTEIKLLPISCSKIPLSPCIKPMDFNTSIALGKHLAVCGVTDNSVHTRIATIKEIKSHIPYNVLPFLPEKPAQPEELFQKNQTLQSEFRWPLLHLFQ